MDVLSQPFDPRMGPGRLVPFPPVSLSPFLLLFASGAVLATRGPLPLQIARPLVAAGFHGSLLAAAVASAWGEADGWQSPAWLLAGLLFLASLFAQLTPWGAVAYLLLPLTLWTLGARCPQLRRVGWGWPQNSRAWFLGAGVGLFLGVHLILSASRTFGYPMRLTPVAPVLAAIAYDAGANVLSSELFFRGVLFNFWDRRWGFWTGTGLSTGACLLRYLADPALPGTLELTMGALFYLTLLSLASCALLALSGSLLPSVLATLSFFGAYRTLQVW